MKNKYMLKNAVSSIFSYGLLLVFSIVSSKFLLVSYGSEVNGLLSSVGQLFSYIALLEAGIGTATITALYQPIVNKDHVGIASVITSARHYYRTSATWYFLCVVVVSFVWPLLLDTQIPYVTIWSVIFLQGISGIISYWYAATAVNYLQVSGRNYVNNNIHLFITLLTYAIKILICSFRLPIATIAASLIAVNILKCWMYHLYLRKKGSEYFIKVKPDTGILKQRSSFLVHEISGVIFASTDTIILSVFCGLHEASVYAVYTLVFSALKNIIGQVFTGTNYVLGERFALDKKQYVRTHDLYNSIYICGVFAIFTVAYWLILPFLSLYTSGITDTNYLDPKLPILFVLIELLSSCRIVDNQLIRIALHAKQTIPRTITESVINLVVSLVAVQIIGIYGVLLGTIAALLYRVNDVIIYTNAYILHRKPWKEYILYLANFTVFALLATTRSQISIAARNYMHLLLIAVTVSAAIVAIYVLFNGAVILIANRRK